jgi:pyruvate ferredoxin oxidoreductase gamma subunit
MGKIVEIRWHGRGGQGAFTASKLFAEAAALYGGHQALAFPSFGPERRGAPVLTFTKISDRKIYDRSEVKQCDYIVVLDETLFDPTYLSDLKVGGKVILNAAGVDKYSGYDHDSLVVFDGTKIASAILGRPITNTVMLGALGGISKVVTADNILSALSHYFRGDLLCKNTEAITMAFNQNSKK